MLGDRDYMKAGGLASRGGRAATSMVSIVIWINVAVFALQMLGFLWTESRDPVTGHLMERQMGGLSQKALAEGKVYLLVTYMFVHGNPLHLLANMLLVYFAGKRVLSALGPKHFLAIYLLGGVLGALAQLLVSDRYLIGASAGAFALVTAFATLMPEMELMMLLYFVLPLRLRAKWLAWGLVGIDVLAMAVNWLLGWNSGVAHLAHLAGALVGWYYVRVMGYGGHRGNTPEMRQIRIQTAARKEAARKRQRWSERFGKGRVVDAKVVDENDEKLTEEIDRVLDKIIREGFQSLTKEERRILEEGSEFIGRRANRR